jgi:hypothetical protein
MGDYGQLQGIEQKKDKHTHTHTQFKLRIHVFMQSKTMCALG